MFSAVKQLAKGTELIAHEMTLLHDEVRTLRQANQALAKHRRAKKTRVRAGGALTVEDAQNLIAEKTTSRQQSGWRLAEEGALEVGPPTLRRYRRCSKSGHNIRTCREVEEMSDKEGLIKCS
jgi:hypothetical protein